MQEWLGEEGKIVLCDPSHKCQREDEGRQRGNERRKEREGERKQGKEGMREGGKEREAGIERRK